MAWIVCAECLSEFQLNQIENYVKHKQDWCRSSVRSKATEPEFNCGYCHSRFNTSLALLLHVNQHDVKIEIVQREEKMKIHASNQAIRHRHETSCESEMDADSCCEDDDEDDSYCGSHGKAHDHDHDHDQGSNEGETSSERCLAPPFAAAAAHSHCKEILKTRLVGNSTANDDNHSRVAEVDLTVESTSATKACDTVSIANSGTAHSASSHHRGVKKHACAQTACTAFEQKSRCCCVDLNGQVMKLVSLGIIKLPDCCDPPPVASGDHFHAHAHRHRSSHTERSRTHSHEHDRSESGTPSAKRLRCQEGTQTATEGNGSIEGIKIERSSPCGCSSGCCEQCVKRERADGECQTEFEWVDFDVDALLDAGAASNQSADIIQQNFDQFDVPSAASVGNVVGNHFEMPNSVGSQLDSTSQYETHSQTGSSEPTLVLSRNGSAISLAGTVLNPSAFPPAGVHSRTQIYESDATFSGGASLESLSLATGRDEVKRAGRYSEAYVAQIGGSQLLAVDAQPLFISRDAGLLFGQPAASQIPASGASASGLMASPHGKLFQCEQCGREFKQAIHLRKHNWSVHSNDGKPYKCPLTSTGECSYSSVEKTHLQAHIRTHTGEKPYKCKYCDYAGKQSSTLRSHMLHKHPQEMLNERQQAASLSPKHF